MDLAPRAFGMWAGFWHHVQFGPALGLVSGLGELDLSDAMPREMPPRNLVDDQLWSRASDSGPTEVLRRANIWVAALETYLLRSGRYAPPQTVLTTFGFVRLRPGIRLSVIYYVRPLAAFLARAEPSIALAGYRFPVVVRPWLLSRYGARVASTGNCWVTFPDETGARRPGVLTADHVVQPTKAKLKAQVALRISRSPRSGVVRRRDGRTMDAAVIELMAGSLAGKRSVRNSPVIGFKPVRMISGRGLQLDAWVVERTGQNLPRVAAQPGEVPDYPAHLVMDNCLSHGDSGCLIVDTEHRVDGAPPYMIFIGKYNAGSRANHSIGLMVEQPRIVWDLEFYAD